MNHILGALLALLAVTVRPDIVQAAACTYGSTQARVQNSITVPWAQTITVGCEKTFNVGSFHNATGQFADDTALQMTGPGNFNTYFRNGDTVRVHEPGTYTLRVTTNNQDGPACTETATIQVNCQQPAPPPPTPTPVPAGTCQYRDTQARVQNSLATPWSQAIHVGCEKTFNVGSFHNGTGQFAGDTTAVVSGPGGFYRTVRNGETVTAQENGIYVLHVSTNGQTGFGCSETATISVQCNAAPPTATPTPWITPIPVPQSGSCSYRDTQARIQRDEQQSWVSSLGLRCGETFRAGSFHNGTGQFANDTTLNITGPLGLNVNVSNAETIRALFPGWYILTVTTNGQSGASCQESAFVFSSCAEWWKR